MCFAGYAKEWFKDSSYNEESYHCIKQSFKTNLFGNIHKRTYPDLEDIKTSAGLLELDSKTRDRLIKESWDELPPRKTIQTTSTCSKNVDIMLWWH